MHALEQEVFALEHEICEDWVRRQELQSREIQDETEDFFNSLDPESWEDKNKDSFDRFILTFRWWKLCTTSRERILSKTLPILFIMTKSSRHCTIENCKLQYINQRTNSSMHRCHFHRHPHTPFWPHHRNPFFMFFLLFSFNCLLSVWVSQSQY